MKPVPGIVLLRKGNAAQARADSTELVQTRADSTELVDQPVSRHVGRDSLTR